MDRAALTAPKPDPDLEPWLRFPGKMEFVQWEPTSMKGKTSRDLGTGPAMDPFLNKTWVKRRSGNNPDRAVGCTWRVPSIPQDAEPSPETHPVGRS